MEKGPFGWPDIDGPSASLRPEELSALVSGLEVRGKCATGYLWLAGKPGGDVVFEFHPGRGKEYAKELLGDFSGYLQRDGCGVSGALVKDHPGRFKPCGCMAHARRKLAEALGLQPKEAGWLVLELRKLYLIERHVREEAMSAEQRHALRHKLAAPILGGLKVRLDQLQPALLPQSPLGKAVRYALAEWDALNRYLEGGWLEIDNNLTKKHTAAELHRNEKLFVLRASERRLAQRGDLLGDRELSSAPD